mmetsp:Transcript_34044/g.59829  ORF Transcript_34044/g.59829 Transcript_34044/m.59829 type:complete len:364 (+) Transcript_34044:122-1213(+)
MNTDEEVAAASQGKENDTLSIERGDHPIQYARQSSPSRPCFTPFRTVAALILIIAIIAVAASGVFSKDSSASSDFDLFDPSTWIPRWLDDNPHGGDTPYDFNTWDNQRSCKGLDLQIINNLDDKWEPYFKRSIDDWENGDPDVLSLLVREPPFQDPECEPVQGVMKVCNGDYGETNWIGANTIVIQWNYIISSVAIMNDYHLDKMSDAAKQNTMCHELGHGFGLGHWDEDFHNRDLGNCMDYTKKPENNQSPDRSNFLFLERMYGNVKYTSRYSSILNGTEGLYCTSSNAGDSEVFKQRKLHGKVGLSGEEFSQYAKLLSSEPIASMGDTEMEERRLKSNHHVEIRERGFENGVKVVSTLRLS